MRLKGIQVNKHMAKRRTIAPGIKRQRRKSPDHGYGESRARMEKGVESAVVRQETGGPGKENRWPNFSFELKVEAMREEVPREMRS